METQTIDVDGTEYQALGRVTDDEQPLGFDLPNHLRAYLGETNE